MPQPSPTTEQRLAGAILQQPETVAVGRRRFTFPRPTPATLIEASSIISTLPGITATDDGNILISTLTTAKDCRPVGDIVATLLLGTKPGILRSRGLLRALYRLRVRRTGRRLLATLTPAELSALATRLLSQSDVASFFALTAFLNEASIAKPTKAGTTTTASGQ